MKKTNKLWLVLLLTVLVAALLAVGFTAAAEEPTIVDQGYCGAEDDGTNLTWTLDSAGLFTISGTGAMQDYNFQQILNDKTSNVPWFERRGQIKALTVENGVTNIGNNAFIEAAIETIDLPDSVTVIGKYAFSSTNIKQLHLPGGVTTIGEMAFNCIPVEELTIPGNVKTIGPYAFRCMVFIKDVIMEEGVETIESCAFKWSSVMNVTIPDSATTIANNAFEGSSWVHIICSRDSYAHTFAETYNLPYGLSDGTNEENTISGEIDTLRWHIDRLHCVLTVEGEGEMPSFSNEEPAPWIAYKTYIQKAVFTGVTTIGKMALNGCDCLLEAVITDSITQIGESAFNACRQLPAVDIPGSVKSIGTSAFHECTKLKNVVFHEGLERIGYAAFRSCERLESISIPDSVTSVGSNTFRSCSRLKTAMIGRGMTSIPSWMFAYCGLESVVIPDSITSIEDDAFHWCPLLRSLTIPAGVTQIGSYVLYNSRRLESITVEEGNPTYHSDANCLIETDAKKLLYGCKNSVIPADGSVTSIESAAFYGSDITEITIPDCVNEIGYHAFGSCNYLTDVALPWNLSEISSSAFSHCYALKRIFIPASVTKIGNEAFYDCNAMEEVFYGGSEEQWGQIIIGTINDPLQNVTVHYNWHSHTPGAPVRENEVPATCTAAGGYDEVVYCTRCPYEFSREHHTIDEYGHSWADPVRENEVAATCTAAGGYDEVIYCTKCPAEISRNHIDVPALGHSWGEWVVVKQATVDEEGLMRRTCQNDPTHVEEQVIPKLKPNTTVFQQFIERIKDFFEGITNWFSRLFRW